MNRRIYITSNGKLSRKSNTLRFESKDGYRDIPVEQVEEIYVLGEVRFNRKLLSFLLSKGILLHIFSHKGNFLGSFLPLRRKGSSEIIVKEVEIFLDRRKRLDLAKAFVKGAIANMIYVLRSKKLNFSFLSQALVELESVKNYNSLLHIEGKSWNYYYSMWKHIVSSEDFRFAGRFRYPPKDRVNAMISFGNSLLYSFVLNELFRCGLDPRIGYLHSIRKRTFALHFDVSEIFKPLIVDRLVFKLINRKQLQSKHFVNKDDAYFLNKEGKRIFIDNFEKHLRSKVYPNRRKSKLTFYGLVKTECQRLKSAIRNDSKFEPFMMEVE